MMNSVLKEGHLRAWTARNLVCFCLGRLAILGSTRPKTVYSARMATTSNDTYRVLPYLLYD